MVLHQRDPDNEAVARMNGDYLAYLFHRPITLLENSTDGATVDLLECAVERLGATAADVDAAFPPIMAALKDPRKKRIVVIAHSQGTLILAVVLELITALYANTSFDRISGEHRISRENIERIHSRVRAEGMQFARRHIKPVTAGELARVELYCFANCASHMNYIEHLNGRGHPWIESFANEHDLVARLGVLAPHPKQRQIQIDGPRYEHRAAWGHLLNAHYLKDIEHAQIRARAGSADAHTGAPYILLNQAEFPQAVVPRLYNYLEGDGSPAQALAAPEVPTANGDTPPTPAPMP
jgi:hypothetical protein